MRVTIAGREFELSERNANARAIAIKVGDRVKVLKKEYTEKYKSHPGTVVAIDLYEKLPTVVVAYVTYGYSVEPTIEFAYFNAKSDDLELLPMAEDEAVPQKQEVLDGFARAEKDLLQKLDVLREKREYFLRRFGTTFAHVARELAGGGAPPAELGPQVVFEAPALPAPETPF